MSRPALAGRRYAGLDPQTRREERRRRLLDAGRALFGTRGYAATPIADVCRQAGVAPVHFYELFPAKEDLLRAVYDHDVTQTRALVLRAVLAVDPADVRGRIRAGTGAFCRTLMQDQPLARVHCVEIVGVSPELERHRRTVIHSYRDLLVAQLEASRAALGARVRLTRPQQEVLATTVVGGVNETVIDWLLATDRPPVDDVVNGICALLDAVADRFLRPTG